ncbi:hypothetical protein BV898_19890, partial [Hypsibius exemplaris]
AAHGRAGLSAAATLAATMSRRFVWPPAWNLAMRRVLFWRSLAASPAAV